MFNTISLTPEAGAESPSGASTRGSHRLAAVGTCERMWALRYHWYFRQTTDTVYRLGGTLIHTAYEYWYASQMPEDQRPAWFWQETLQDKLRRQAAQMPEPIRTQLFEMALANLAHYMQRYAADQETFKVVSIEEEYRATLRELDPGGPWPELDDDIVTCRTDLVYENAAGYWVMDYKSHGRSKVNPRTGRLTRWKDDGEYGLNWQVLWNLHILRKRYGSKVRGFVIQRTTRQEPYDFDRTPLTIPPLAYEEAPRVMRELVKYEYDVMSKVDNGEKPSPRFHACYGRYGPCDYRDVCMASSPADQRLILENMFTQPPEHELLAARAKLRVI